MSSSCISVMLDVPLEEESPAGEPEVPDESAPEAPEDVPEGESTPSTAGASGYRECAVIKNC